MSDNTDFEQVQILFSAQLTSLQSKVKALKKLLTEEQLEIFTQIVLKDKEVFLSNNKEISEVTKEKIEKLFC